MSVTLNVEVLSAGQAARLSGLSVESIRRLANLGQIPCTETPLGRLFDRRDIERLIAAREAAARTRAKPAESRR